MHAVFEAALTAGKAAVDWLDWDEDGFELEHTGEAIVFDEEKAEWVQSAIDWVHTYLQKLKTLKQKASWWCELKLPVGEGLGIKAPDDCWGTADWVCYSNEELVVLDLKGGYVYVEVEDNYQLLLYAIGAVHSLERGGKRVEHIRLVIAQPRAGGNKELVIRRKELNPYVKFFRKRAEETYDRNASIAASEKACGWCGAAGICKEAQKMTSQLATEKDWPVTEHDLPVLTEEKFLLLLDKLTFIRSMCDRAEEMAVERLMNGEEVTGFKLVESNKHRRWKDEEKAAKFFSSLAMDKDIVYNTKLKTPAQMSKVFDPDLVEKHAEKPVGDPRLAKAEDPRKELKLETTQKKLETMVGGSNGKAGKR